MNRLGHKENRVGLCLVGLPFNARRRHRLDHIEVRSLFSSVDAACSTPEGVIVSITRGAGERGPLGLSQDIACLSEADRRRLIGHELLAGFGRNWVVFLDP